MLMGEARQGQGASPAKDPARDNALGAVRPDSLVRKHKNLMAAYFMPARPMNDSHRRAAVPMLRKSS
jgi:hypothetical protein